ncbi:hypothetical protein ACFPYJ_17690 [Paenibacillus solisilvae]|uniref:Cold shock domain-containing protein n=1 Tax=Paenibacillus solisilvae TaxID=2486751 RepID=A0ABW0W0Y4_9BACL
MSKFFESKMFEYRPVDAEAYAELMARIGPSISRSPRLPRKDRAQPELLPVADDMLTGEILFYDSERGFGRLGSERLFFHIADVVPQHSAYICEGVEVAYRVGNGRDGRTKAVNIQLV